MPAADLCVMIRDCHLSTLRTLATLKPYLRSTGTIVVLRRIWIRAPSVLGRRWSGLAPRAHIFLFTSASLRHALGRGSSGENQTFQDQPTRCVNAWSTRDRRPQIRACSRINSYGILARWTAPVPLLAVPRRASLSWLGPPS